VNPGFTIVADNLPGVMQYLDLVRDCISVFDLPRLPPNEIQEAHPFDGSMNRSFKYAAYDHVENKKHRVTSKQWVPRSLTRDDDEEGDGQDEINDDEEGDGGEGEELE